MKGLLRGIIISNLLVGLVAVGMICTTAPNVFAAGEPVGEELRLGTLGVVSGPAAMWGLVSKYCALTSVKMWNAEGGLLVDGVRHPIKVFSADTKLDIKLARLGAEKLAYRDKVRFMIGPNTDEAAASALTVLDEAKIINVAYGFDKKLYSPKHPYCIFGMIANYQSAPIMYKYIMDRYGAKTIAFAAPNNAAWIQLRDWNVAEAKKMDIKITSYDTLFDINTTDFTSPMAKVMKGNPDIIDTGCAGSGAIAQEVKTLRQLGYKGVIVDLCAGDENVFNEIAGEYMEGFLSVGGATTEGVRTGHMEKYMEVYKSIAGEWNDEAATKLYAMEMLRETIKIAGAAALTDSDAFRAAIPKVRYKNPYIKGNPILKFVGKSWFGHSQQIGVPIVIVEMKKGKFEVVHITSLED